MRIPPVLLSMENLGDDRFLYNEKLSSVTATDEELEREREREANEGRRLEAWKVKMCQQQP